MPRRMEPRDANELALDDKLDVVRTLTRLRARIEIRRELNELEAEIKQQHAKEIEDGRVSQPVLPSPEDIRRLYGFGASEIGPGGQEAGSTHTDPADGFA